MKFIKILTSLFVIISCNYLFGIIPAEEQYITYSWTGNEDNLCLNFTLNSNFEIPTDFTILTANSEDGSRIIKRGCRIVCKPKKGANLASKNGLSLVKIIFEVIVENIDANRKVVPYTINWTNLYAGKNNGKKVKDAYKKNNDGNLNNPSVDLSQEPKYEYDVQNGTFIFKNSFPFSQL